MLVLDIVLMTVITLAIVALLGVAIHTSRTADARLSERRRPRPTPAHATARGQRPTRRPATWAA